MLPDVRDQLEGFHSNFVIIIFKIRKWYIPFCCLSLHRLNWVILLKYQLKWTYCWYNQHVTDDWFLWVSGYVWIVVPFCCCFWLHLVLWVSLYVFLKILLLGLYCCILIMQYKVVFRRWNTDPVQVSGVQRLISTSLTSSPPICFLSNPTGQSLHGPLTHNTYEELTTIPITETIGLFS